MNYINVNNQHPGARGDFDAASEASSMEIENEVGNNVNTRARLIPKPKAFSGRRNELPAFLGQINRYFKYNLDEEAAADDEFKIDIISSYLEGNAAEWFADLVKEESPLLENYENFIDALQQRYKSCASSDVANSRLTKIRSQQFRTIAEYCNQFEKIARDSSFNDEAKIHFFIEGLPTREKERTKLIYPRIRRINELINVVAANAEEDRRVNGNDPMDIDQRRIRPFRRDLGSSRYQNNYRSSQNYRESSPKRSNKPKKCFICKSTSHLKENCPKQQDKIRRREKILQIKLSEKSLAHTYNVVFKYKNGFIMSAILDTGSDLNIMDRATADKYQIPVQRIRHEKNVIGFNGNGTIRYETIPLTMVMGQHIETIQFYIYSLPKGISVILGNPWLKKHCPTIEFDKGNIRFSSQYCKRNCCATAEDIMRRTTEEKKKKDEIRRSKIQLAREIINNYNNVLDSLDNNDVKKLVDNKNKLCSKKSRNIKAIMKKALVKKEKCIKRKELNKGKFENYAFCYVLKNENKDKSVIKCDYNNESVKENKSLERIPKQYEKFKNVFDEQECNELPPHRPYDCKIRLKDDVDLFYGPLYPLTEEEREALKEYIKENLEKGFIRPSTSPAGAPILFVRKKDGSLRLCVDYRRLNENTIRDSYPLPLITELFDRLREAKYFTKLDLKSAYNLVRIREGDEYKTAFRTRYGHFEYLVMPFGLKNAPATFQHFINDVLGEYLDEFAFAYIDDILIYSETLEEHRTHVKKILKKLQESGLYAKLSKCEFEVQKTTFLGHIISDKGISMDPDKVKSILEWPVPTTVKEVQSFVGLCNYYRRFIPNFAKITKPLHNLTRKDVKYE